MGKIGKSSETPGYPLKHFSTIFEVGMGPGVEVLESFLECLIKLPGSTIQ